MRLKESTKFTIQRVRNQYSNSEQLRRKCKKDLRANLGLESSLVCWRCASNACSVCDKPQEVCFVDGRGSSAIWQKSLKSGSTLCCLPSSMVWRHKEHQTNHCQKVTGKKVRQWRAGWLKLDQTRNCWAKDFNMIYITIRLRIKVMILFFYDLLNNVSLFLDLFYKRSSIWLHTIFSVKLCTLNKSDMTRFIWCSFRLRNYVTCFFSTNLHCWKTALKQNMYGFISMRVLEWLQWHRKKCCTCIGLMNKNIISVLLYEELS